MKIHEVFFLMCRSIGHISSGGISIRVQEQALVQKLRHEGLDVAPDGVMLLRKRGGATRWGWVHGIHGWVPFLSYGPMVSYGILWYLWHF